MRARLLVVCSSASALSLLTFAIPSVAAPITFANAVLGDNPIAYWRFGEAPGAITAVDAAIGHDGTYSALGITLGQPGIAGGDTGALFDGMNGRVTVPDDSELGPDHISMEALVRWDGQNGFQQRILEKSFFLGGEQASYSLSIRDDGKIQVEVRAGGGPSLHTSPGAITPGAEAYLVGVFDGDFVRIYQDGNIVLQQGVAFPGALQDGLNPLGIGNQFERNRPFKGLIDELALYDYGLSEEQVREHFAALQQVPEPGTAMLLLFGIGGWMARRRPS